MQKNHFLIAMALCAGALATSAMGCELIASVDRSLLQPGEGGKGGGGGEGGSGGEGGNGGNGGEGPSCTDNKKNGDETDVDCGGDTCPKCELGKACSASGDCDSGFCADGVCCDTACDEACDSCTAMLKEDGSDDGTCGASKVGAACGEGEASCTDGVQQNVETCDEEGACVENEPTECGPFACDEEGTACLTECETDEHCALCHVCGDEGTCVPAEAGAQGSGCAADGEACNADGECKAANGETCDDAADCGTGRCVDGVCCDTACDGECQACNVADKLGTCSPVAAGTLEPACTAPENVCDSAGACKKAAGENCDADEECASNRCIVVGADGICGPVTTMSN